MSDLKNTTSAETSTSDSARFLKTCRNQCPKAADNPVEKAMWAWASTRAQSNMIPATGSPPIEETLAEMGEFEDSVAQGGLRAAENHKYEIDYKVSLYSQ